MKRIYSIILVAFIAGQLCKAQTPINDPTVYVTVNGSTTGDGIGGYFANPITADCFIHNVYNGVYSGNIEVRFEGGDYYTDFVFEAIPAIVQSIRMYGGWNSHAYFNQRNYDDRDFYHYETRFHATGNDDLVRFNGVGYYYVNGANTCIIDGITFTGEGNNYSALSLLYGDHVISQCKFEKFVSTNRLIWMETANHTVTYTSCLFARNTVANLMALCTNVNLINVTIADNYFSGDMFIPFNQHYTYNLQNSIIYYNNNMHMASDYFNVSHSILEHYESWVNNISGNYFSTNPQFTGNAIAPYSCDFFLSPAINSGYASFITSCPFYDSNIMDYDVMNMYRYYDYIAVHTDIGAYQNGYEDGSHLYSTVGPVMYNPDKKNSNLQNSIWSDSRMIYVDNTIEGAVIAIYNVSGQIVYKTSLQIGLNAIEESLGMGIYIARTISSDGQELASKSIILQ